MCLVSDTAAANGMSSKKVSCVRWGKEEAQPRRGDVFGRLTRPLADARPCAAGDRRLGESVRAHEI